MVDKTTKKSPTILPSWWHRGPAGMVEEWETRVSQEEITRRQKRRQSVTAKIRNTQAEKPQSRK